MLIRDYSSLDQTNPVADVPLNVGLVGWWLGLPNVSGGNQLWDIAGFTHGTIVNFNPSIWRRTQRGFGALDYNGTNQNVNLSTSDKLSITGSFTYSAWINTDVSFATTQSIMGRFAGSGARGPYLRGTDSSGNKIQMFVTPDGSTLVNRLSSSNITVGQDAFVAGVYNSVAQTLDVYINGVLSNGTLSGTVPSSVSNPGGTDFKFGIRSDDSDPFNGRIDDIRIHNRALTASEIWALYQHGLRGYKTDGSPLRWRRRTFFIPEQVESDGAISGTCALTFDDGSSVLTGSGALAGTAANVFDDGSSTLTGSGALAGTAANTFDDGSSVLSGAGALAGSCAVTFTLAGSMGSGAIAGTCVLSFAAGSSTLTGAGALAGSAANVFDDGSSTLTGSGALAGVAANTFTLAGSVVSGALAGSCVLVFGAGSSTLTGSGALAGTAANVFTLSATTTSSFTFDTVCPLPIPLFARTPLEIPMVARDPLAVPLVGCRNEV